MPNVDLTKTTIDNLPVSERDVVYWDRKLSGFGLKVTPRGRKVFFVQYRTRDEQKQRKFTIGKYGDVTPAKARLEAQTVLGERHAGQDPAKKRRDEARRARVETVADVMALFVKGHVSRNRSSDETVRIIERDILPLWGNRSIHSITKRDVVSLIDGVVDRGAPIMANRVFAIVRKFFNWCVGKAILDASPCLALQAPGRERARDRILDDGEIASVLRAARVIGFPFGQIVELLLLTGQRRSEVAGMCWEEIDFAKALWTMEGVRTKNGKPHLVHLSTQAIALIEPLPRFGSFVFATRRDTPYQAFTQGKKKIDALCGFSDWVLHDLRRTVVSGMARLGVLPHVADKILNHQSGSISGVVAVYQRHEFETERRAALELWARHLEHLQEGSGKSNVVNLANKAVG